MKNTLTLFFLFTTAGALNAHYDEGVIDRAIRDANRVIAETRAANPNLTQVAADLNNLVKSLSAARDLLIKLKASSLALSTDAGTFGASATTLATNAKAVATSAGSVADTVDALVG